MLIAAVDAVISRPWVIIIAAIRVLWRIITAQQVVQLGEVARFLSWGYNATTL